MTGINTSLSSLLSFLSPQGSASGSASLTQSLADALNGTSTTGAQDPDAFQLDLSPSAQQLLSAQGSNPALNSNQNFTLSSAQQKQVSDILAKYKDAPFTQDSFNQIVSDLEAVGLGASQLSQQDQLRSFSPTMVFLNVLNGLPPGTNLPSATDEQTKQKNYLQSIEAQWKSISTTAANS